MIPRWARERRRKTRAARKELMRQARDRVGEGFILNKAQVGEWSNGALLLRLEKMLRTMNRSSRT